MPDTGINAFEEIVPVFSEENQDLFWFWGEEPIIYEEEEEDWSFDDHPSFALILGAADSAFWDSL